MNSVAPILFKQYISYLINNIAKKHHTFPMGRNVCRSSTVLSRFIWLADIETISVTSIKESHFVLSSNLIQRRKKKKYKQLMLIANWKTAVLM